MWATAASDIISQLRALAGRAWIVPWLATLACFAVVLGAGQLATLLPPDLAAGPPARVADLHVYPIERFFTSDAGWYHRIAAAGYRWDSARPLVQQDVAFFPLWPLLLACVSLLNLSVTQADWITIGIAAGFAALSIQAFHVLAQRLLAGRAAATATFLFALSPGASFLLQSYPTGLANLLSVLALLALMDGRYTRAAIFSGIVTAAGPLGLGTAITVFTYAALHTIEHRRTPSGLAGLAGLGVLSVAGLLGLLAWQFVAVGDPFAFIKAQEAWAPQLSWAQRVPAAALQLLILPEIVAAVRGLKHVRHAGSLVWLYLSIQKSLYRLLQCVMLLAIAASRRLGCGPVLLHGIFTLALFIWFHSTSRPGNSTPRLMYCAVGIFLGAAWFLRNRPRVGVAAVIASAVLLAAAAAFTVEGYPVT